MKNLGYLALPLLASCSSEIDLATDRVQQSLINPQLAFFKDVRVLRPGLVCGEVNGTDQFGYYTGFTPFAVKSAGGDFKVTVANGPVPNFPTSNYPIEELSECFPQLEFFAQICTGRILSEQSPGNDKKDLAISAGL